MKKSVYLCLTLAMAFILFGTVAFAAETPDTSEQAKPVVATIYINNAKSTYDNEISKKLSDRFNAKLSIYDIQSGDKYIEKLNKMGITDITTAERTDILQAFSGDNIDYVVYAEIQPPIIKSWQSMFNIGVNATVTIPVKILDVKNNKYLYNGKFTEAADNRSMFGGVGTKAAVMKALDLVLIKTDEILAARLPIKQ